MSVTMNPATETDPVRRYTSEEMLREIESRIEHNIRFYAAQPRHVITERIEELRQEWSMERYLQVNITTVGLLTSVFALTRNRSWGLITSAALGFFLYHGLRGFDPPIPLLRQFGIRTRREIDRELYALKALRGDFEKAPAPAASEDFPAWQVLNAVST